MALTEPLPNREIANGTLAYGYIDHIAGLTYEILSCAFMSANGNMMPYEGNDTVSMKCRAGSVSDCEIYVLADSDVLINRYKKKIDIINEGYRCSEEVAVTRELKALDESRSPEYPDDVIVHICHGNNNPEGCWVRIEGVSETQIVGRLLNEPNQDFNVHEGDMIGFELVRHKDAIICVAEF